MLSEIPKVSSVISASSFSLTVRSFWVSVETRIDREKYAPTIAGKQMACGDVIPIFFNKSHIAVRTFSKK